MARRETSKIEVRKAQKGNEQKNQSTDSGDAGDAADTVLVKRRDFIATDLRLAEGIATGQAGTVVEHVVVNDFAKSGAHSAPGSSSQEPTQNGSANRSDECSDRSAYGASSQAQFSAVENACCAAGGTGHRTDGTAGFFTNVFSCEEW